MWKLLNVEGEIGTKLTDSQAMWPASSVSALVFAHPKAEYFVVGQVTKDQITAYAERKQSDVAVVEKWLAPILGYAKEEEKDEVE